ncbi:hypothetical protein [Pseudoalteromonas distincta]|uniref:Uncharacterized protein n=1 Tax=Pseudoalteromonas distincta TaxID=77608 RepID=A0A4P9J6S3_9GAMM|nr:hypothetical protein [Pseudoalteromonas distincta]QCU76576.1 hypothetical protein FFU37_19165 [Pseudoalteromonas distincta]
MSDQRIKIPRASDKALISCFKDLAKITGVSQISVNALGFAAIGDVDLDADFPDSLELILKKNSAIIDTISLNLAGLPISFHRGGNYQPQEKSGIFDEIVFRRNHQQGTVDNEIIIEAIATINKKLKAFDAKRSLAGPSEEQAQFDAIHNSNIERLESLNEELVKSTHEYRLQLDREYGERITKLESDLNDKKATLDEEFANKESTLSEQLGELDRKRKELDDSSNTHARREIRRDILKEIKARQTKFSLTDGTNSLRKPIAIAMLALIAIFIVLAGVSVKEFYEVLQGSDINKIIIASIKQAIYSAGAIGSVIFLIRWMNRWFELHSQSEFELKHFELDMERASWLVETSLEWKDAKGTAIPPELLDSLSNNLFSNEKEKIDPLHHPADQLASALMGSASSVKLKAGDSSIEIDPKKLAKTKSSNAST